MLQIQLNPWGAKSSSRPTHRNIHQKINRAPHSPVPPISTFRCEHSRPREPSSSTYPKAAPKPAHSPAVFPDASPASPPQTSADPPPFPSANLPWPTPPLSRERSSPPPPRNPPTAPHSRPAGHPRKSL